MAGLNFVGNAAYAAADENSSCENGRCGIAKTKVAQFEFIPWILSLCATVDVYKRQAYICAIIGGIANSFLDTGIYPAVSEIIYKAPGVATMGIK